jgi:hypothetical protein
LQTRQDYRFWRPLENGRFTRYEPADGREFQGAVVALARDIERFLKKRLEAWLRFEIRGVADLLKQALAADLDGVDPDPPHPYKYHVFISYTSREGGFPAVADMVATLVGTLEQCRIKSPPYFYDKKDIGQWSGDPEGLKPVLQDHILDSYSMVAIMTPQYAESPWCCWEWNYMKEFDDAGVQPAFWTRLNSTDRLTIERNLSGISFLNDDVYLDEGWNRFKEFIARHNIRLSAALHKRLEAGRGSDEFAFTDAAELEQTVLREIGHIEPKMEGYARALLTHIHEIGEFIRRGYQRAASRQKLVNKNDALF